MTVRSFLRSKQPGRARHYKDKSRQQQFYLDDALAKQNHFRPSVTYLYTREQTNPAGTTRLETD